MTKNKYLITILVSLMIALIVFGLVMIYSASYYGAEIKYDDSFYFVKKQIVGVSLGIVLFVGACLFNYQKYYQYRWHIVICCIVLLVLVFVPFIGISNNGASRWVGVGGFTIQPSEIAKFGFVIFAACYLSKNFSKMTTFKGMLPLLIVGGSICFLILLEPNLSVTLCIGMVMLAMLYVGGVRGKYFLLILIPAILLVPILILIEPYRLLRLTAFLDPWANPKDEGFQLIQSLYSLGGGGLFGVGLFNSRQKYLFLSFSESDFIFSIIGEELGFIGCTVVCIVYFIIIICGFKIALNAKDRLGCYLAFGITMILTMQLLINVAVVSGSIPPTGIPLPFISAGGTSLSVFMGGMGILVNVGLNSYQKSEKVIKHKNNKIFKSKRVSKKMINT